MNLLQPASLRGICIASVLFGILLCLLPEGREKQIASLCATAALVLMLLELVAEVDWGDYALSKAEAESAAASISSSADAQNKELNRFVIERKYEEYIWDKAADLSIRLKRVEVSAAWSGEGVWVPRSVVIGMSGDDPGRRRLAAMIEEHLGIGARDQEWIIEEAD